MLRRDSANIIVLSDIRSVPSRLHANVRARHWLASETIATKLSLRIKEFCNRRSQKEKPLAQLVKRL
jgi:hypothetical protein